MKMTKYLSPLSRDFAYSPRSMIRAWFSRIQSLITSTRTTPKRFTKDLSPNPSPRNSIASIRITTGLPTIMLLMTTHSQRLQIRHSSAMAATIAPLPPQLSLTTLEAPLPQLMRWLRKQAPPHNQIASRGGSRSLPKNVMLRSSQRRLSPAQLTLVPARSDPTLSARLELSS